MLLALPGLALVGALAYLLGAAAAEPETVRPRFTVFVDAVRAPAPDAASTAPRAPRVASAEAVEVAETASFEERWADSGEPALVDTHQPRFVDAEGAPIAGARVVVRRRPAMTIATAEQVVASVATTERELFTDALGAVEPIVDEIGYEFEAEIEAPGLPPKRFRLVDPGTRRIYRVDGGGSVAGTVFDEAQRRPVAGIAVEILHDDDRVERTVTNADGHFEFHGITPKDAVLRIFAPEFRRYVKHVRVFSDTLEYHDVWLKRGAELQTAVVDAQGRPGAGVRVTLLELNSGLVVATRTTDEEGLCRFAALRPGYDYLVAADHPRLGVGRSLVDEVLAVDALSGEAEVFAARVQLGGTWVLRGRALAPGGSPVAGAAVVLESEASSALGTSRHRPPVVVTGADGTFAVEGLLPDLRYTALVYHTEFAFEVRRDLDRLSWGAAELPVGMRADHAVQGQVLDEAGSPVPYASVFVTVDFEAGVDPGALGSEVILRTDAVGRYVLEGFPPGARVRIQAVHQGRRSIALPLEVKNEVGQIEMLQTIN